MPDSTEEKEPWLTKRKILWYLVFIGFGVNYMIRINLNIAIVSMVKSRPKNNWTLISECITVQTESTLTTTSKNYSEIPGDIIKKTINEGFDWDEHEQGLILGSFYWVHWLTQIPGGILAQKYGTKMVFGWSNLLGVLLCFLIPTASFLGPNYLIFLRVIQGFITGFSWPAMHALTAKWIPPNERSKFVTAYLGSSFGTFVTFVMCGYIIANYGWERAFHTCGIIGTLWYVLWHFFVFDCPMDHPRISIAEKSYISKTLGRSVSKEKAPTPWKSILTSFPVWLNVMAQTAGLWGLYTSMTHAPTYFKLVHGWNIRATGFLSGLPHLSRVCFAYLFSQLGDFMLTKNIIGRTNLRKLATTFACTTHGLCLVGIAYSGCNYTTAVIFLTTATAFHGAVSTGSLASFVDLSPNYASILLGISGMVSSLPGFISPIIVGYLTFQNQTVGQWQKVFLISSTMLIIVGLFYVCFAKSELQSWNSPQTSIEVVLESELRSLNKSEEEEIKREKSEKRELLRT